METAEIVKIAVSAAPYSIDKPYDYLVPPELLETAVPGVRVTVPFGRGNRTSEGIILARTPGEKMQGLKPLLSVLDRGPVLDGDGIALALWLRQRYFCTLFEAVKAILPAGLWYQIREVWHVAEGMDRCAADGAATGIRRAAPVLDALFAAGGSAELSVLEEACGWHCAAGTAEGRGHGLRDCGPPEDRRQVPSDGGTGRQRRGGRISDGKAILPPAAGGGASPGGRGADERGGGMLLHRRLHGRPPGDGEGGDRGFFSGRGAAAAGPDGGGTQRSYRPQ